MSVPVRNSSSSSSVSSTGSSMNERRSSSLSAPFKNMGHKLAQHHREVQAAYEVYYNVPKAPNTESRRTSEESQRNLLKDEHYGVEAKPEASQSKSASKWERVKQAAKEHHDGVNAAYRAYYGIPTGSA